LGRSRSKLVFLKFPSLQELIAFMQMTALDLKPGTHVNVCLVALVSFVRSEFAPIAGCTMESGHRAERDGH
jgi:hypothetical protein